MNDHQTENALMRVDQAQEVTRENLRIACAIRRTNPSAVALQAGLSRNVLNRFIQGEANLTYRNILAVCEVLDIPIALLAVANSMTPARIRLQKAIEQLPPHLVEEVITSLSTDSGRGE